MLHYGSKMEYYQINELALLRQTGDQVLLLLGHYCWLRQCANAPFSE